MNVVSWAGALVFALWSLMPSSVSAQMDPRMILQNVIQQLSTGTPNPSWYGPQLWATIAVQTGNSGIYPQLIAAGAPINIVLLQQQQMPQGVIFRMQSQHANGNGFEWLLGLNLFGNRIEYMNSNPIQASMPGPGPGPSPSPNPGPKPTPASTPNPGTTTMPPGGSACEKFPDLC